MNLVYMYTDNFLKTKFEEITTYPWFYRMNQTDIYFDEVGIGGTISHVTTEYGNLVPDELKVKNDEFSLDFFHKHYYLSSRPKSFRPTIIYVPQIFATVIKMEKKIKKI